ncbi:hypothetical protein FMZ60_08950 [Alcaligenaceae bacterium SJ-26]|nr:hypothetical protein FMZ60_08950 [Alcaligenaceae bacterium SJ-26]
MANPIEKLLEDMSTIKTDEIENEYLVPINPDTRISVPFQYISTASGQRDTLLRLVRKNTSHDTILAFVEKAKQEGHWK